VVTPDEAQAAAVEAAAASQSSAQEAAEMLLGGAEQPEVNAFGSFFKDKNVPSADRGLLNRAAGGNPGFLFEPYVTGDDANVLTRMPIEELAGLQDLMRRLGYVGNDVRYGSVDSKTVAGFRAVLGESNQNGKKWDVLLQEQKEAVKSGLFSMGDIQGGLNSEPMVLPDYASLRSQVRSTFRNELGRDPTQAEMQQFSNGMMQDYRNSAQANRKETSDPNPFADEMTGAGRGPLQQVDPGFINQIDPGARFEENFERLYAGQRDSLQDQNEVARVAQQASNNAGVRPQNTSL
jgi:hypothetical protein